MSDDATIDVLEKDGYDAFAFGAAKEALPDLADLERRGAKKSEAWPTLLSDVWAGLYKATPREREDSDAPEAHRDLIRQMMESLDYDRMRATTKLSRAGAAIATLEMGELLVDKVPEGEPKKDAGDPLDRGWSYLDGCESPEDQGRAIRSMVRRARHQAEETVETMKALGWGSDPGGDGGASNLEEAAAVSRDLRSDAEFRMMVEVIGRMRRVAVGKRPVRARRAPEEVVGVEVGGDISRALPSELALLTTPLREATLLRWTQGQLLQYELTGAEKMDLGPIVVCIDSSGSMAGKRDVWAKAVAMGLMAIAQRERRHFAAVLFSGPGSVRVHDFGERPKMGDVLKFLREFLDGGTNFEEPLDKAMSIIEGREPSASAALRKADVVMITDGNCAISDAFAADWRRRSEATGAHLYTVYIGSEGGSLDALSDGVARASRLDRDAEALDLAFGI